MNEPPANVSRWRRSRYGVVAFFAVTFLAACTLLRVGLFAAFPPAGSVPLVEVAGVFLHGLHRDGIVTLLLALPTLTWFLVLPERWAGTRGNRWLVLATFGGFWLVQVFIFAAEVFFFEEFRSRFNTVAVDYLLFPQEVFGNIWQSYPVAWVVAACAVVALAWVALAERMFRTAWAQPVRPRARWAGLAAVLAVLAALLPTVNLQGARVGTERTLNELANNGALSFVAAWWTRHLDYATFYRTLPRAEAYQRVRRLLAAPGVEFVGDETSLRRKVAGDPARPRLNVVLLLEESLGSEFWGSLGRPGPSLTPEMDRLAATGGLLFTNLYASGNRTVRGLEGVLSSFPPLPGDSIVVRDRSENVETLARLLQRDGYRTGFVYGGRGVFDHMRPFMLANGFETFTELKHFAQPTFTTAWGVADEDIFRRAISECRALHASGAPFFVTCLSVSNHKPYTYPRGRIAEDPEERLRENAVKYSDWALGLFFQLARQEAFWTNTIFAVVADHGARVYGSQSIPIKSYEIPLLIAGPAVVKTPARVPHLGGSLDVAPTILGLIGRPYETLFFGRDLLRDSPAGGRAVVHHNRDIGLYDGARLVTLGLQKTAEHYRGDPKAGEIQRAAAVSEADTEVERDATALFQVADELYIQRRYTLGPAQGSEK